MKINNIFQLIFYKNFCMKKFNITSTATQLAPSFEPVRIGLMNSRSKSSNGMPETSCELMMCRHRYTDFASQTNGVAVTPIVDAPAFWRLPMASKKSLSEDEKNSWTSSMMTRSNF